MNPITVAIVYHSGFGHTARLAKAVKTGVERCAGANALLIDSEIAHECWTDLAAADAIIFGTPTYMGGPSAEFKQFMDASSSVFFVSGWKDKIAGGFTNSASRSGDKLQTLVQLSIFAAQHAMHWVSLGLPPGNNRSDGSENDLNRLGFFLGVGAQSNADEGPELAPPASDLSTAEHLGERIALVTTQLVKGRLTVN